MKKITLIFLMMFFCTIFFSCTSRDKSGRNEGNNHILEVPNEYKTIAEAVRECMEGDTIIISPGKYFEKNIEINKAVTISSEWKLTGDLAKINETIIDPDDSSLFIISADGVEISGLHIINGDHTLDINSNVTIMHNHFINNLDAMSFEGSGGGYAGYNYVENDRDDGLDLDIRYGGENHGSNILIEHNTIVNSNDDGMEIRLYDYASQNINYIVRENTIIGSKNAGIQLISYDIFTGKVFQIHHNIISGCKTGLGCMEGSRTQEDLTGASKMDELVWFFNNTLVNNQMGATGGNKIIAFNNVVQGNSLGGFKRFGLYSAVMNNLFYLNGGDDFIEFNEAVRKEGNLFSVNPLLDNISFIPSVSSPCINAGISSYNLNENTSIEVASKYISGTAPDIGAIEFNSGSKMVSLNKNLIVDAGEDIVLVSPDDELILKGKITGDSSLNSYWKMENGPGKADIINPDKSETKVRFHQSGIYQFSFVCSNEQKNASDNIIIRYTTGGEGKRLFLEKGINNIFEAEEFYYSYGNASVIPDPARSDNMLVRTALGDNAQKSSLEYSVGTSDDVTCNMWLMVKNQNSVKSTLQVRFNNLPSVNITASDNKEWKWIKVPVIRMTAGQWPLLIRIEDGAVLIDKIVFSYGNEFKPD